MRFKLVHDHPQEEQTEEGTHDQQNPDPAHLGSSQIDDKRTDANDGDQKSEA